MKTTASRSPLVALVTNCLPSCFKSMIAMCAALPWLSSAFGDTATFNTAGTFDWVCPPGVTSIQVECWGGGGAGGLGTGIATGTSQNAGGGGGGAYARKASVPVTAGQTYTITIPAAAVSGSGGQTANNQFVNGSPVTFTGNDGVTVTAAGGSGGRNIVVTVNSTSRGTGGAGGLTSASVGDVGGVFAGGSGAAGTLGSQSSQDNSSGAGGGGAGDSTAGGNASAGTGSGSTPGAGGVVGGGIGGTGRIGANTNAGVGGDGATPGGGGGGGKNVGNSTRLGGKGGLGQVVLTYTVPPNFKKNNTDLLSDASSWTAFVPTGWVAEWNNIVTGANTASLGADLTFSGIKISDPGGLVTINSGNTLTLGSAAIDLDLSTATQNLALNCDLVLGAANVWDVASGRTATLGGMVSGSATVAKQGLGTAILSGESTYSGATTVTAGSLVYPSGSNFSPGGTGGVSGKLTINGAGAVATVEGTYTATGNGDAYYEIKGGGLLNFNGNANFTGGAGIRIGEGSAGTMNMTGGTLTATMNSGSNLVVGRSAGGNGTLNLFGGALTVSNAGGLQIGNTATNSGVVNVSGTGQLAVISTGTSAMGPGIATLNLNTGGTFTLGANLNASGTSTINFDGGTLKAGRSSTALLPASLTAVNILAGGAIIDTNGFDTTLPGALLSGVVGDGGLTKTGLKTLILSGSNTYTGGTMVSDGTLKFASAVPSATDVTVDGGAEAGVLVGATDGQWVNTGNLTLQNSGAVVVDYGSTAPSTIVAPIQVTNFSIGTTPGIRLISNPSSALSIGQAYPLVTWTGSGPATGIGFVSLTHRLLGTFSVSSKTLYFTVTGNAAGSPISWKTGNGNWNTSSANWLDGSLVSTTYFDTLDSVLFGDASGASGNPIVTLGSSFSPLAVTMNSAAHDYTLSGAGTIGGSGSLTLDAANTRTLTLATSGNSYTGGTTVNGGTLVLGDATNTLLDTGAVAVDGASAVLSLGANSDTVGAVSLKNGAAITGSGTLTGSSYVVESGNITASLGGGALNKTSVGTVILSGGNSYTGATTMSAGTLRLAHAGAVQGSSQVSMTGSSTLEFATDTAFGAFPLLSGSSGFIHTLVSDRATPGAGLIQTLGSSNLGNSTFNFISGPNVTSGTAGFSLAGLNLTGGAAGTTVLNPSTASVLIPGAVSIGSNNFAKTLALSGDTTGNEISGAISNGLNTLALTKSGASNWTLSGANTYSGITTVSGGTLNLTGSLTNASLGNVVVQAGGNLAVAGTISGSTSTTNLTYGTTAGLSTVNVSSGANLTLAALQGANNAAAVSVYRQTGGSVTVNTTGTSESAYAATSGYGILNLSGGSYTVNSRFTVALNGAGGGKGVARVGGGAGPATLTAGDVLSMSRGAGSIGEMTVLANGSVTFNGTGTVNMLLHGNNSNGAGYLNIVGGTFSSPSTTRAIAYGNGTATNTSIGMINLGSGTLELGKEIIVNTVASGTNRGFVNLSGGTVKLLATTSSNLLLPASNGGFTSLANTVFGKVSNSTVNNAGTGGASGISSAIGTAQDFTGGVTIDTNGFDSTISGPLVAPTGGGVAQGNINITDPGADYVGAPLVTFSNPAAANATPAAGYALVSGGQLSGIVITSPGSYDPTDTVTVTLTGGGASAAAAVADIPGASLTANTSGGLAKAGDGTLTLGGVNTYTGNTVVSGGTLSLEDNAQMKFVLGASSGSNSSISGLGTVILEGDFLIDTSAADSLSSGTWVLENIASLTGAYGSNFTVIGFNNAGSDKWTKTDGSKTYTFDESTGTLTLASGSGFSAWQTANSTTGGIDDDHDGDGVSNGIEFFTYGPNASSGFTALPGVTNNLGALSVTWTKAADYNGSYGTDFVVETSNSLSGTWTPGTLGGTVVISGNNVTYTFPTPLGAKRFARLKVTGP